MARMSNMCITLDFRSAACCSGNVLASATEACNPTMFIAPATLRLLSRFYEFQPWNLIIQKSAGIQINRWPLNVVATVSGVALPVVWYSCPCILLADILGSRKISALIPCSMPGCWMSFSSPLQLTCPSTVALHWRIQHIELISVKMFINIDPSVRQQTRMYSSRRMCHAGHLDYILMFQGTRVSNDMTVKGLLLTLSCINHKKILKSRFT